MNACGRHLSRGRRESQSPDVPPVQLLQVLRPTGSRTGALGESNHGKCGLVDNLNGQLVQTDKAPLV